MVMWWTTRRCAFGCSNPVCGKSGASAASIALADRRAHFGELVQLDGSHDQWFEKRAPKACLMNMVDDAQGTTLSWLAEEETIFAAMQLLWQWIDRYGIPQSLYTECLCN